MRVYVIIDGRLVGDLEYELPKDSRGRSIPLPARLDAGYQSELQVLIIDPGSGARWSAFAKLEPS